MNITQIEINVKNLLENFNQETFIYDLLLAFGLPKASISRLQKSGLNLSKIDGEILWKKKLFFQVLASSDLYSTIDSYKQNLTNLKHDPRFIIITDYQQILAIDSKTLETLDSSIAQLDKNFTFFLPWAGMEKATYQSENPADVKAAEKMARLFDEIRKDNPQLTSPKQLHSLNVFLSRLLFCFFAEDTGIFPAKLFTNAINNYTQADGTDLHSYLDKIFSVMNHNQRDNLADYIACFPYVNGGLFRDNHSAPQFTRKSRQLLLDNGELDWSVINPDIFGSMMQAVVDSTQRSGLGMHYTSVPNIMKVIEPLFLNDLKEEFEKSHDSKAKLDKLLARIALIKIFDPACGSGNFLIIAYKELRNLEIAIMQRIDELTKNPSMMFSQIHLSNFYGIEIDDFAHEIAKLSLWLAEHQMNMIFEKTFGRTAPALPLKDSGNIVCANACRIDWEDVCPKTPDDEIYVLGNPPYLGYSLQNLDQKNDIAQICKEFKQYKELDYISCWFIIGARYLQNYNIQAAFVSTNSICQGEQVEMLWPRIFALDIQIKFAYTSFKWLNNAKSNAGVTCVIIGLSNSSNSKKHLFYGTNKVECNNINAYLAAGTNIIIGKSNSPISNYSQMLLGNMAKDNGHLFLTFEEINELLSDYPQSKKIIKLALGSKEFIRGEKSWCLWIDDEEIFFANQIPIIAKRLELVRAFRLQSKAHSTSKYANHPNRFMQRTYKPTNSIIVPRVSSERRDYIPIGFLNKDVIIKDSAYAVYDATPVTFAVISSKMHMAWVKTLAGRLKTDYRYSSTLCYNTFPFPHISEDQKKRLEMYVFDVLDEREKHSEKTLAELYDPDKMPVGLRAAHHNLDIAIDQCYRLRPFASDEERLEHLFTLYEQMTSKGANNE